MHIFRHGPPNTRVGETIILAAGSISNWFTPLPFRAMKPQMGM